MFRKLPYIVFLLHAYVGWRLLPDIPFGSFAFSATALWLVTSVIATPLWPVARQIRRQPLKDRLTMASMVAIGAFYPSSFSPSSGTWHYSLARRRALSPWD